MRAVMEVLGVHDVVGKSIGSSNPYNMVRATFDALKEQASPRSVASKRGLKVQDVVRITSYNVCYTKLLREEEVSHG